MTLPAKAVLLTHAYRTGSNLVASIFGNNQLGVAAEHFNRGFEDRVTRLPIQERRAVVLDLIERSVVEGVFAAKLPLQDIVVLSQCLGCLDDPIGYLKEAFTKVVFVHVGRRDIFLQSVSLWRARISGEWYRYYNSPEQYQIPPFDFDKILDSYMYLCREAHLWRHLYTRGGMEPHRLCYEDLDSNLSVLTPLIFDIRRHLDLPEQTVNLASGNVRQRDALSVSYRDEFVTRLLMTYAPA